MWNLEKNLQKAQKNIFSLGSFLFLTNSKEIWYEALRSVNECSVKVTIKCQRSLERTLGLQFDEVTGIRLGECGICFQWKRMINFYTHNDHAFCRACLAKVECCPLCRNTKKLNLKTQPKAFIVLPEKSFLWDRAKDVRFLTLENIDEALSTESEASGIIVTNK